MKKIVLEIEFEEVEEFEEKFLRFSQMKTLDNSEALSKEEIDGILESWAQSDWYWVGFSNALPMAFEGKTVTADDIRSFL